jgi:hypothetical protein
MIELVGNTEFERHIWLESLLREGVYEISFTKLDGTTRTMPCTLKKDLLPVFPVTEHVKNIKLVSLKIETIRVWVTDIEQWRSFRVMNITEIKPV